MHFSSDLDGVDPSATLGVGTPVPGGLSIRESHLRCETAAHTGRLLGEPNPTRDQANQTGPLAVWLITRPMGKPILYRALHSSSQPFCSAMPLLDRSLP